MATGYSKDPNEVLNTSGEVNQYGGNQADKTLWWADQGVTSGAAQTEQARLEALRQKGLNAAQGLASTSAQGAQDLAARSQAAMQAMQAAKQGLGAQQAGALAAGTAAGAGGGSAFGALGQAAKQAGILGTQYGTQIAQQGMANQEAVNEANKEAGAQSVEALKMEAETGSHQQDQAKKVADYMSQAQQALASTKSFFWDDNKLGAQKIRDLIRNETDPEVVKQLNAFADRVQSGEYDY